MCSALRACGAYNPTELKRLQHGQKIQTCSKIKYKNKMLHTQNFSTWFLKIQSCMFFGLFQGKICAFSKALESAICCRPCVYNAFSKAKTFSKAKPFPRKSFLFPKHDYHFPRPEPFPRQNLFPRHDYPSPRPKSFPRPESFLKASLLQGKPFSRQAFFKARKLFQGQKTFSRPEAFCKARSLLQGQEPFARPAFFKASLRPEAFSRQLMA